MDLIEEYLNNAKNMKMSPDDYGDTKKVRKHNRLAARNRKIAVDIEQNHRDLKSDFFSLIYSEDEDVRVWAAHHILESMTYELHDRQKALNVIKEVSKSSKNEVERSGNEIWLKEYYKQHPTDAE